MSKKHFLIVTDVDEVGETFSEAVDYLANAELSDPIYDLYLEKVAYRVENYTVEPPKGINFGKLAGKAAVAGLVGYGAYKAYQHRKTIVKEFKKFIGIK